MNASPHRIPAAGKTIPLLAAALLLTSCQCPPKGAPKTEHCKYIGPTATISFVGVSVQLWNPADLSASMPSLQLPKQSLTGVDDSEILSAKFTK